MYQIKCDDYILYDPRDESLVVTSPKLALETNTVGKGSFTIHSGHPYYDCLSKLKSVFTVLEDGQAIFRGRMTDDSKDWNISKKVELEGVLAYLNDSIIEPFNFPEDFASNADYVTAAASGNVVQFFLNWLITQHNSQVESYQEFKLGNVTVADANNFISRSSEEYLSTWEVISGKLFKSNLGGKLCIRYEADGNYIDYLSEFAATNSQAIEFGENLLDLVTDSSAIDTYSAILPIGKDGLTIESIADGDLTSDLVKSGKAIYSKSAKTSYGYICKTVKWDDVTEAVNLKTKAQSLLSGTGVKLANAITVKAVDLHCTDAQIVSFRINRKVTVNSAPHGYSGAFDLTKLDIDILSPQNTTFTLGETVLSLADINAQDRRENTERVEKVTRDIGEINGSLQETNNNVSALVQRVTTAESSITQQAGQIATKVTQTQVDNSIATIKVGDKNLILNSNELITVTSYFMKKYAMSEEIIANETYTAILKGTLNATTQKFGLWENGSSNQLGLFSSIGNNLYTLTFKAVARQTGYEKTLTLYNVPSTTVGLSTIEWIKVVHGNKTSLDWTPAPEDIQTQISNAESEIKQNADDITLKVSKDGIVSAINLSSEELKIAVGKIALEGYSTVVGNFSIDATGNVKINGDIHATNFSVDDDILIVDGQTISSGIIWATSKDAGYVARMPFIWGDCVKPNLDLGAGGTDLLMDSDGAQLSYSDSSYLIVDKNSITSVYSNASLFLGPGSSMLKFGSHYIQLESGGLSIDGAWLADFVISQGTWGNVMYKKWNSGIAETWEPWIITANITSAWGVLYDSGGAGLYFSFPPNFFIDIDSCLITAASTGSAVMVEYGGGITITRSNDFWLVRPTPVTGLDVIMYCHAIGRWK